MIETANIAFVDDKSMNPRTHSAPLARTENEPFMTAWRTIQYIAFVAFAGILINLCFGKGFFSQYTVGLRRTHNTHSFWTGFPASNPRFPLVIIGDYSVEHDLRYVESCLSRGQTRIGLADFCRGRFNRCCSKRYPAT